MKNIEVFMNKKNKVIYEVIEIVLIILLLIVNTSYIVNESYNPFLYFRFWGEILKEKLLSIIFILIIGIHFLLGIIIPDREISFSERRKLTQRPNINIGDIVSGSYMDRLNDYLLDQIVFRDNYMYIYGLFSRNIYRENVVVSVVKTSRLSTVTGLEASYSLIVGKNTIVITVTSQNGSVATYNLELEVEDNLTKEEANKYETSYIKSYKTNDRNYGYNLTLGGDGNN